MQVPDRERKEDELTRHDGNRARDGNGRVARRARVLDLPHAPNRQRGRQILHDAQQDHDAARAAQHEIHRHEELAQPPQDPVTLEVLVQRQQRADVRAARQQAQHPDDEEVVRHHGVHARQANGLDRDAREHLLVGEGEEEFARDGRGVWRVKVLAQDDERGQDEGRAGRDDEREEDARTRDACVG